SGLRSDFGVSVSSIRRGDEFIPLPAGDTRIFPGDTLGVIGTDSQIKRLNDEIDRIGAQKKDSLKHPDIELKSILLTPNSPIIDRPLYETDLRHDYFCMVLLVQRGDKEFNPTPNTVLEAGDLLWIVGDPSQFDKMK
ncbi:MAG: TrkA C-terminal domain-containing protein, partial [Muribaculaceae bacterium]|nr:TrkA C-terminal domain-containing protein [Muribaculaceae bacterium]